MEYYNIYAHLAISPIVSGYYYRGSNVTDLCCLDCRVTSHHDIVMFILMWRMDRAQERSRLGPFRHTIRSPFAPLKISCRIIGELSEIWSIGDHATGGVTWVVSRHRETRTQLIESQRGRLVNAWYRWDALRSPLHDTGTAITTTVNLPLLHTLSLYGEEFLKQMRQPILRLSNESYPAHVR